MQRRRRPLFVVAILLYVTLDLSLPTIPGAFEFDAADSVESTQTNRGRGAADTVVVPPLARDPFVVREPRVDVRGRLAETSEAATRRPSVVNWLPRTPPDSAPPSEDPH